MDEDSKRLDRLELLAEQTRLELRAIDLRLAKIETRLDQTATKSDLQQAINSMVKWVVGTMFGAGVAAVTIMTFVLNNATPKAAAPPLVIQLPYGALPAPPVKP
jgi:tetrahydromethanopterin S-methyltransferase subunit G